MGAYLYPQYKIIVFAKAPIAGQVKTRMQPQLNSQQCAQLHSQLLRHSLSMLQRANLAPVLLCFSGPHQCWQQLQREFNVTLLEQAQGDLGRRMAAAASHALLDAEAVILLGSDCPFISADYLQQAFCLLQQGSEVVFGPADDGGYVLLATKQLWPELFADIAWGTADVLSASCAALKVSYQCLHSLADIDRPDDLKLLASLGEFKHWLSFAP